MNAFSVDNPVPEWDVMIVNGEPEVVINRAALKAAMKAAPIGEAEARRRLLALGVPPEVLED